MITCPTCGAQNDPANRFCDQCGSRLEPAENTAPTISADAQPTVVATTTCPSCGAAVLPGEAFCDTCGAPLPANTSTAAPTTSNDAPTILATPADAATPAGTAVAADSAAGVICPVCGHQNMPGDTFCDNCGADLTAPAPTASNDAPTALAEAVTPASESAPPLEVPAPADSEAQSQAPASTVLVTMLSEDAILPAATDATTTQPSNGAAPQSSGEIPPPADATPTAPASDSSAERQRLEEVIATQQKVIAQLEQTQAALGAATPDAILQTLQGARDTLAQAESDLASLPTPAPAVDPAEVARLEEAVATQQKVVSQLEQTQAALGAATPTAIQQALQDAQAALAQAQSDLQALTGSTPAATSAAAVATPPTQETASVTADQAAPSEIPPTQPAAAPAPGPRLVMVEGDKEVTLPTDKAEIVIGREDPISQIFPEVDLTPYGGEGGGVSRQHARLNHQNGQWTITDLNSTNYTRVDGTKIEPNTPVTIQDGARLQFGRIAAVFHA